MASTNLLQAKVEITFSIPIELQEDYNILMEDITTDGSFIVDDIQEEIQDGTIKGAVIITVENNNSIQEIVDNIEQLEQGTTLLN